MRADSTEDIIDRVLKEVITQFNADYVFISEVSVESQTQHLLYERSKSPDVIRYFSDKDSPFLAHWWFAKRIFSGKGVMISNVDDLTPIIENPKLINNFKALGICS